MHVTKTGVSEIKIIKLRKFKLIQFCAGSFRTKILRYANIVNYCIQNQNKTICKEEEETNAVNSGHFILPIS